MSYVLIIIFLASATSSVPVVLTQEFTDPRVCEAVRETILANVTNPASRPAPRVVHATCTPKGP